MNRILVAAILFASCTSVFGQTKEEIVSSKERIVKIQKLESPKATTITSIDELQDKIKSTALVSVSITPILETLYYRSVGQSVDGITDITVKKPTLEELEELALRIYAQAKNLENMSPKLASASKDATDIKNPLKIAKAVSSVNYAKTAITLLGEETTFQVKAIKSMIQTLTSSGNL